MGEDFVTSPGSCLLFCRATAGRSGCRYAHYIRQMDGKHLSPHAREPQRVRGCLIPLLPSLWGSTGPASPFQASFQQVAACWHTKRDVSAATAASSFFWRRDISFSQTGAEGAHPRDPHPYRGGFRHQRRYDTEQQGDHVATSHLALCRRWDHVPEWLIGAGSDTSHGKLLPQLVKPIFRDLSPKQPLRSPPHRRRGNSHTEPALDFSSMLLPALLGPC